MKFIVDLKGSRDCVCKCCLIEVCSNRCDLGLHLIELMSLCLRTCGATSPHVWLLNMVSSFHTQIVSDRLLGPRP